MIYLYIFLYIVSSVLLYRLVKKTTIKEEGKWTRGSCAATLFISLFSPFAWLVVLVISVSEASFWKKPSKF